MATSDYNSQVPAAARQAPPRPTLPALRTGSTPLTQRMSLPPLTQQQAAQGVYVGERQMEGVTNTNTIYGVARASQGLNTEPVFVPQSDMWKGYLTLSEDGQKTLDSIMDAKYGAGKWGPSWRKNVWSELVQASLQTTMYTGERMSPLDIGVAGYINGDPRFQSGDGSGGGGGGGGGGGYSGPITQVSTRLTDPDTAGYIVNQALEQYLGRGATAKERDAFTKALNAHEAKNPTVSVTTPGGAGMSSSVTKGGSNAQAFAEEYGAAQEGSAEYTAATTFLGAFMDSLSNPVG